MGKPSNQSDGNVRQLISRIMNNPGHAVPENDLHDCGVDVDMVVAMYSSEIKPYAKYLDGYRYITESQLAGLQDFQETRGLMVLDVLLARPGFHSGDQTPNDLAIKMWMTRHGEWIVWHGLRPHVYHGSRTDVSEVTMVQAYTDEAVRSFDALHEALVYLVDLEFDDMYFVGRVERHQPKHLPFMVGRGLRGVLQVTIEAREDRLRQFKQATKRADERMSTVTFPVH